MLTRLLIRQAAFLEHSAVPANQREHLAAVQSSVLAQAVEARQLPRRPLPRRYFLSALRARAAAEAEEELGASLVEVQAAVLPPQEASSASVLVAVAATVAGLAGQVPAAPLPSGRVRQRVHRRQRP